MRRGGSDWRVTRHESEYSDGENGFNDDQAWSDHGQGSVRTGMQADWERGPVRSPSAGLDTGGGEGDAMVMRARGHGVEVGQAPGPDLTKGDKVRLQICRCRCSGQMPLRRRSARLSVRFTLKCPHRCEPALTLRGLGLGRGQGARAHPFRLQRHGQRGARRPGIPQRGF